MKTKPISQDKPLSQKEQEKVRGWCQGWYGMDPARRGSLVDWIMLKLSVDQATAGRYARWLERDGGRL